MQPIRRRDKASLPDRIDTQPGADEDHGKHDKQEVAKSLKLGIVGHFGNLQQKSQMHFHMKNYYKWHNAQYKKRNIAVYHPPYLFLYTENVFFFSSTLLKSTDGRFPRIDGRFPRIAVLQQPQKITGASHMSMGCEEHTSGPRSVGKRCGTLQIEKY